MRKDADITTAMDRYGDIVLRVCVSYLASIHDAEDAFQDVFLRYATNEVCFTDEEHRKAWLIRVTINLCKDRLRVSKRTIPLSQEDEGALPAQSTGEGRIEERLTMKEALQVLPSDHRTALLLSVVEGYTASEIAAMMGKPENTIYSYISRGKRKLKKVIEDGQA